MKEIIANEKNVRHIGRTYMYCDVMWSALSGSGAEFDFCGKYLAVKFLGDGASRIAGNDENYVRAAIYADGERVAEAVLDSPKKTVVVFDDGEIRKSVIRIIKLSECAMSTVGVAALETDDAAEIAPTEPLPHSIEFIGDSITCGYGVDDEDPLHHFKTVTEDVTKAYAYKTAAALGAEYSMFSTSGYGIITGFTDNDVKRPEQAIPLYYESYGFSYRKFADEFAPHELKWDFDRYRPELIVINLGTNDDSYCKDIAERQDEYSEQYVNFLKVVRGRNPFSEIICCVGIMGQRIFTALERAVDKYKTQSGDERVSAFLFDEQDRERDGLVADYHPTAVTHDQAAARLTAFIREKMNW